jgi:hypothetical protein
MFLLRPLLLFSQPAPLLLAQFPLIWAIGLSNGLRDRVGLAIEFLHLLQMIATQLIQLQKPVDVRWKATVTTILLHGLSVLDNEFAIQHRY